MKWFMSFTVCTARDGRPPIVEIGNYVTGEHPLLTITRWNRKDGPAAARGAESGFPRLHAQFVLNWYAPLSPAELTALFATGLISQNEPNVLAATSD